MGSFTLQTRLTIFACLLALVVVALGAFTRLVDAGLGCPDWPGCYGHLTWPQTSLEIENAQQAFPHAPVDTDKTWPEMVHRYFAGSLGLVILTLAVMALKARRRANAQDAGRLAVPVALPWMLVALVVVQALFGMWTVTLKLWPQVVTAHLLGGFATLSLLWLMVLRLSRRDLQRPVWTVASLKGLRRLALVGLLLVAGQITLGGWTSSNYAALACIDLPTCHGDWLPTMDFSAGFDITQTVGPNYLGGRLDNDARTAIHWSHRVGALLVSAVLVLLVTSLWRSKVPPLRQLAVGLSVLLLLQVGLGATNILATLPLAVAVAHNAGGALLLLGIITVNYQLLCLSQMAPVKATALTAASTPPQRFRQV